MLTALISPAAVHDWQEAMQRIGAANATAIGQLAALEKRLAAGKGDLPLGDFVASLEAAGRAARPSVLAWSAGLAAREPFGEDVGRAVLGCRSLGTALYWICQYFPLLQDASSLRLDVDETWTTLSYKILDPGIWPRHEDAMYTLGIFAGLVKRAAPDAWSQVQVTVEAEAEQVDADLAAVTRAGVVYGGNGNGLRFPTSIINAPLNLAPPAEPALLKKLTARLSEKNRATPVAERTRQVIYERMNDGRVSQDEIARELGISGRTLRRRLAEEEQSFQMVLDECRMAFAALEFRTRKRLSLSDMALRLGYSEHSTFSRAFARWSGMAPQEYRRACAAH